MNTISMQGNFAVLYFGKVDDNGRRGRLLQMAEAVMESGAMPALPLSHRSKGLPSFMLTGYIHTDYLILHNNLSLREAYGPLGLWLPANSTFPS